MAGNNPKLVYYKYIFFSLFLFLFFFFYALLFSSKQITKEITRDRFPSMGIPNSKLQGRILLYAVHYNTPLLVCPPPIVRPTWFTFLNMYIIMYGRSEMGHAEFERPTACFCWSTRRVMIIRSGNHILWSYGSNWSIYILLLLKWWFRVYTIIVYIYICIYNILYHAMYPDPQTYWTVKVLAVLSIKIW